MRLNSSTTFAVARYVRAILLAGDERLFLNARQRRRRKRLIVGLDPEFAAQAVA